jgi:hypothetical protein
VSASSRHRRFSSRASVVNLGNGAIGWTITLHRIEHVCYTGSSTVGEMPEWFKGPVCKIGALVRVGGSNPSLPTEEYSGEFSLFSIHRFWFTFFS